MKNFSIILLILIIAGFLGWFLSNRQTSDSTTVPVVENNPSPIVVTELELANPAGFQRSVVTEDNCDNPLGLTSYTNLQGPEVMRVNSLDYKGHDHIEKAINSLEVLLNNQSISNGSDLSSLELPFRNYCGGGYSFLIKELAGVSYPGMDKTKVLLTREGNGFYGDPVVRIYGLKGRSVISLVRVLSDIKISPLSEKYVKECEAKYSPDNESEAKQSVDCYHQLLQKDPQLEVVAREEADRLIKLFALKTQ